jgi:parallel beta-helix repeat protein
MKRHLTLLTLLAAWCIRPAQAEITDCTEITTVPKTITTPGIWCLKSDISSDRKSGSLIRIAVGGVTLDLNGHTLNGLPAGLNSQAVGIRVNNTAYAIVRNGTIRGFSTGLLVDGASSANHILENLIIDRSLSLGVQLGGSNITFRNNIVSNSGGLLEDQNGVGIRADNAPNLTLYDNQIVSTHGNGISTGYALMVNGSPGAELRNNTIKDHGYGILVDSSNNVLIDRNRIFNGGFGVSVTNSTDSSCTNNVANVSNSEIGPPPCSFESGNQVPP